MREKYLPIGTVVTLKGATKEIMVIGYLPMVGDKKEVYDYSACTFPEGVLSSDKTLAFNHDQIEKINFVGLENDESKKFDETIKKMIKGFHELKDAKLPDDTETL